jgi:membrane-associated phospholipid phosphatase
MSALQHIDQQIFFFINHQCHIGFLNKLMPYWRSMYFWFPLYLFFITYLSMTYGKKALVFILALAVTVTISDTFSSKIVKPLVHRVRPCNDVRIKDKVKLLVNPSSGYSFTSSHAANHFAVAVFLFFAFAPPRRWIGIVLLIWAGTIAFGQVYVGIHYPSDILFGGLLGASIGLISWILYRKYLEKHPEMQLIL